MVDVVSVAGEEGVLFLVAFISICCMYKWDVI